MFGLGKTKEQTKKKAAAAPNEPLRYHADLVEQLKEHQDKIYADFKVLALAAQEKDKSSIETMLVVFKRSWHAYLMEKNVKLYSYLKHQAELSAQETMDVNGTRAKNTALSRSMNRFLFDQLRDGKLTMSSDAELGAFSRRLQDLGEELIENMRTERSLLFPIYQKSGTRAA